MGQAGLAPSIEGGMRVNDHIMTKLGRVPDVYEAQFLPSGCGVAALIIVEAEGGKRQIMLMREELEVTVAGFYAVEIKVRELQSECGTGDA
jgi:hypothetical protein